MTGKYRIERFVSQSHTIAYLHADGGVFPSSGGECGLDADGAARSLAQLPAGSSVLSFAPDAGTSLLDAAAACKPSWVSWHVSARDLEHVMRAAAAVRTLALCLSEPPDEEDLEVLFRHGSDRLADPDKDLSVNHIPKATLLAVRGAMRRSEERFKCALVSCVAALNPPKKNLGPLGN